MKFNRVAVFTDNSSILEKFVKILDSKNLKNISLSYYCSFFSNIRDFDSLNFEIEQKDIKLSSEFFSSNFDLIISLHCKQIFPTKLIHSVKCINIHPGYNPINRGWYTQVFSIIENIDAGATIHEIDEYLDHGKVIAREKVVKFSWDTSLSLYNRIVDMELFLVNENIECILNNEYSTVDAEMEGKVYLKKDFEKLLKLDLNKTGTFKSFIDHLRALTHGEYNNAYFIDVNGKKIFIKIQLEPEK